MKPVQPLSDKLFKRQRLWQVQVFSEFCSDLVLSNNFWRSRIKYITNMHESGQMRRSGTYENPKQTKTPNLKSWKLCPTKNKNSTRWLCYSLSLSVRWKARGWHLVLCRMYKKLTENLSCWASCWINLEAFGPRANRGRASRDPHCFPNPDHAGKSPQAAKDWLWNAGPCFMQPSLLNYSKKYRAASR